MNGQSPPLSIAVRNDHTPQPPRRLIWLAMIAQNLLLSTLSIMVSAALGLFWAPWLPARLRGAMLGTSWPWARVRERMRRERSFAGEVEQVRTKLRLAYGRAA